MDQKPKTPCTPDRALARAQSADDPQNWMDVEQKIEMKITQLNRLMHHFAAHPSSTLYPDLPYQVGSRCPQLLWRALESPGMTPNPRKPHTGIVIPARTF